LVLRPFKRGLRVLALGVGAERSSSVVVVASIVALRLSRILRRQLGILMDF